MIDICDFAVGLSRQLYGLTIASERPGHRMMEQWHPLGPVRDHLRLQLSRRGLGVECGAGAGLRRQRDLEAVGKDAADARSPCRPCSRAPSHASATRRRALSQIVLGGREAGEALANDARMPVV